jgi:anti-anti-sigma factor
VSSVQEPPLEVLEATLAGAPGVAVRGELDLATAPLLAERLEEAIRESEGAFVADLSELGFLDSSGLHALLRALALLGREDRLLALVCPPGSVRRVLELAGVADMFTLYDSREDAARALVPLAE